MCKSLDFKSLDIVWDPIFAEHTRGNPGNQATADEMKAKFRLLAGPALGECCDRLIALMLEDASMQLPVKELADILAGES